MNHIKQDNCLNKMTQNAFLKSTYQSLEKSSLLTHGTTSPYSSFPLLYINTVREP